MLRAVCLAALALIWTPAQAQLVVERAETTENKVVLQLNNTVYTGNIPSGSIGSGHEVSVDWGVVHGWRSGLGFTIENTRGGATEFDAIEWSNTFAVFGSESVIGAIRGPGYGDLNVSLYTAFETDVDAMNDLNLAVGPILDGSFGGFDYAANLIFDVPLGGDGETSLGYAAYAMYRFTPQVSGGLESHSTIPRFFGNTPKFDDQTHFIGPSVAANLDVGAGQEVEVRFGGLFGISDSSPDFAASLNFSLELF